MDQRWRKKHSAESPRSEAKWESSGDPVFTHEPPTMLGEGSFEAIVRPGIPAGHFADPEWAAAPTDWMLDVRACQSEVERLTRLLASQHADHARQVHEFRAVTQQRFASLQANFDQQAGALKNQLCEARENAATADRRHRDQERGLRGKLEIARQTIETVKHENQSLGNELKHVAESAVTQQGQLKTRHANELSGIEARLADSQRVKRVWGAKLEELSQNESAWRQSHRQLAGTAEWLNRQLRQRDTELEELGDYYEQHQQNHSITLDAFHDEIEVLEATVAMLRTDHETVELVNADLDQRIDQMECLVSSIQLDCDTLHESSRLEKIRAAESVESMRSQCQAVHARLMAVSEEKQSLIASLAKMKHAADEFDAALFAKDQEIDATKRVEGDLQRQLVQLRREHDVLGERNAQMRKQIREQSVQLSDFDSLVTETKERCERAEAVVGDRDRQVREIQSAARAGEANSILQANEAEQEYAIELERVETEFEVQIEKLQEKVTLGLEHQSVIEELKSATRGLEQTLAVSVTEKDRLQQTVDDLSKRCRDATEETASKSESIQSLQHQIQQAREAVEMKTSESGTLRSELGQRKIQLADYANQVAAQQQTISEIRSELVQKTLVDDLQEVSADAHECLLNEQRQILETEFEKRLQDRLREFEQRELHERERQHQGKLVTEQEIESLRSQVEELSQKCQLLAADLSDRNSTITSLRLELSEWAKHKNLMDEVKRLSTELSRTHASHARERGRFQERLAELHDARQGLPRAA